MPRESRALTRITRTRAREKNLPYQQAREHVITIHRMTQDDDLTWAEAEDIFDDPANQLLCSTCGWTVGMVCPECSSGCGCNNGRCSGWRHDEFMDPDVLALLITAGAVAVSALWSLPRGALRLLRWVGRSL